MDDEGLREPLRAILRRRLRLAVVDLVVTEPRRRHPVVLHAGVPGGLRTDVEVGTEPADHGLRTDVVAALLRRVGRDEGAEPPMLWLTRPGDLTYQDVDARWLAAALAATTEAALPLTMVVVTKRGWRDPRSGLSRTWVRLRVPTPTGADSA
jgi:hypothetical protein